MGPVGLEPTTRGLKGRAMSWPLPSPGVRTIASTIAERLVPHQLTRFRVTNRVTQTPSLPLACAGGGRGAGGWSVNLVERWPVLVSSALIDRRGDHLRRRARRLYGHPTPSSLPATRHTAVHTPDLGLSSSLGVGSPPSVSPTGHTTAPYATPPRATCAVSTGRASTCRLDSATPYRTPRSLCETGAHASDESVPSVRHIGELAYTCAPLITLLPGQT